MNKTYRPGVYSRYDIISRQKSYRDRYAFYCGSAKLREGKNLPAGGVVQLHSPGELNEFFEAQDEGRVFVTVCEILLKSGVAGVYAVPITVDGTKAQSGQYALAIQKLCEVKRSGIILCDSTDPEVLQTLCRKVEEASQNERERVAVGGVETNAVQTAQFLNSERMVLCAQEGKTGSGEGSVIFTAAALAAMLAVGESDERFHSVELEELTEVQELDEDEIEELLGNGVTALEENNGRVECIRCVTSRTSTDGEADRTFASVNVVLMIDEIIQAVRGCLKGLLKGRRGGISADSIASQAAVVLDEKMQEGKITRFEPPIVYSQEDDPNVCIVELEFGLASVLSQIYLTAHISI